VFAEVVTRLFEVWTRADNGELGGGVGAAGRDCAQCGARARPNEIGLSHFLRSWFALWRGDPRVALHHADLALQTITGRETFGPAVCCNSALALAAVACGDMERAHEAIGRNWVRAWRGAMRVLALLSPRSAPLGRRDGPRSAAEAFGDRPAHE
jgi:ATP/maltotriose-dependent transcriptional regulator MalT